VPYSQRFIFFVNYKWAQRVIIFVFDRYFQFSLISASKAGDLHSSLLGPFVSYEDDGGTFEVDLI
jgi:hypothetical protein